MKKGGPHHRRATSPGNSPSLPPTHRHLDSGKSRPRSRNRRRGLMRRSGLVRPTALRLPSWLRSAAPVNRRLRGRLSRFPQGFKNAIAATSPQGKNFGGMGVMWKNPDAGSPARPPFPPTKAHHRAPPTSPPLKAGTVFTAPTSRARRSSWRPCQGNGSGTFPWLEERHRRACPPGLPSLKIRTEIRPRLRRATNSPPR